MSVGLEEYMDSLEVKPDGFKLTLVYWGREPSDNSHPLHMLLEMLKHQFDLELKKQDVQMMNHNWWQVDMLWSGSAKELVSTAKKLDEILQIELPKFPGNPEFNFDVWNYPPAAEDDEF